MPHLLAHQSPELVQVDDGAVVVVLLLVEVPHTNLQEGGNAQIKLPTKTPSKRAPWEATNLSEETRVVLVKQDAVVVLATSITATTRVLAVLANAAMTGTDVSALFAVLP